MADSSWDNEVAAVCASAVMRRLKPMRKVEPPKPALVTVWFEGEAVLADQSHAHLLLHGDGEQT